MPASDAEISAELSDARSRKRQEQDDLLMAIDLQFGS